MLLNQDDFELLLQKRWKQYRAAQRCRRITSSVLGGALQAAGITAIFLQRIHLLKQARKEKIVVE